MNYNRYIFFNNVHTKSFTGYFEIDILNQSKMLGAF